MKILTKILTILLPIILLFSSFSISNADELSDIEKKLADANAKLQKSKNDANQLLAQSSNVNQSLSQLKSNIFNLQTQIIVYSSNLDQLIKQLDEVAASIDQKKSQYNDLIRDMSNITRRSTLSNILNSDGLNGFYNNQAVYKSNVQKQNDEILILNSEIDSLNKIKTDTQKTKNDFQSQLADLTNKKQEYENQLVQIQSGIANNKNLQSNLSTQITGLVNSRGLLFAQQNEVLQKVQPLKPGNYYFTGKGRNLYDGHGVGLSQWGAYGMALNHGFTSDQILKFYYTGIQITSMPATRQIVVDGKTGPISFDDYLAGIGEVPNDWPKEAVKAQVIAARTYAMKSAYVGSDGNYHICGTDYCQVYNGGTAKRWAVDETKDQVITYNGTLISAVYSAFHVGHSEDNEKTGAFNASVYGSGGSPQPYLRGVDDSAYAYVPKYPCPGTLSSNGSCIWRTNGYSLDDLSAITSSNTLTNVGKMISISIQRGSSERAWKVTLIGSTGTKTAAGWKFMDIWNTWIANNRPDGQRDYIYSTMFYFGQ